MKLSLLPLCMLLLCAAQGAGQQPLYIVNGKEAAEVRSIPPGEIEKVETLPADEQTIARYGPRAVHGVMLITLRYDEPARFPGELSFDDYIAGQVRWDENEPAARVVLRYKITPEGRTQVCETLESTDNRLKRRVLKAVAQAPLWQPAVKGSRPVESEGILSIRLPAGKPMPHTPSLIIR